MHSSLSLFIFSHRIRTVTPDKSFEFNFISAHKSSGCGPVVRRESWHFLSLFFCNILAREYYNLYGRHYTVIVSSKGPVNSIIPSSTFVARFSEDERAGKSLRLSNAQQWPRYTNRHIKSSNWRTARERKHFSKRVFRLFPYSIFNPRLIRLLKPHAKDEIDTFRRYGPIVKSNFTAGRATLISIDIFGFEAQNSPNRWETAKL